MKKQEGSKFVPALGFHWLTPYYDLVIGTTLREQMFKMALIEQSRLENNHRVLDLASGTGTLSIWLKQRQPLANVIGVDSDPAIISIAAAKAQKANVSIQFDHALSCNLRQHSGKDPDLQSWDESRNLSLNASMQLPDTLYMIQ
jgi:2-polyprenyl-3-methyl-5-hydroxy-6-metoxy-1,4-benzoquinol methylase